MIIKFNDTGEFIEELKAESVIRPVDTHAVLRLTNEQRTTPSLPGVSNLSVIATFKNHEGDIIRLERYVGELWGLDRDDKLYEKVQEIHKLMTDVCRDLNIEVRAGVFMP